MMVELYSVATHGSHKLSNNFKVVEFACKDGSDRVLIDTELVKVLQKIRDHFGKPITINSAYRNAKYNEAIGGVANSQHVKGTAADIYISGIAPSEVAQYAEHLLPNTGGIGLYTNFVHIDVRKNRSRWTNYGKEVVVSGFPGYKEEPEMIESANDIIWELMNGKLKVEITEVDQAVEALEEAKQANSSLYWILRKIVNS